MASWQQWLAKGDVKTHQTSKQEIDDLRALIIRDLADAAVAGLSADRRFATATRRAERYSLGYNGCGALRADAVAGFDAPAADVGAGGYQGHDRPGVAAVSILAAEISAGAISLERG